MKCVRLLGHAGSDIESQYNSQADIERCEANDPLLHTARILYDEDWLSTKAILDLYQNNKMLIEAKAMEAVRLPKMTSAKEIMSSLLPKAHNEPIYSLPEDIRREKIFASAFNQLTLKRNLCQNINFALTDLMMQYPNMLIFGEDVGKKGGCLSRDRKFTSSFRSTKSV